MDDILNLVDGELFALDDNRVDIELVVIDGTHLVLSDLVQFVLQQRSMSRPCRGGQINGYVGSLKDVFNIVPWMPPVNDEQHSNVVALIPGFTKPIPYAESLRFPTEYIGDIEYHR